MKSSGSSNIVGIVLGLLLVVLLYALDGIIVMLAWNDTILPTFRNTLPLPYLTVPVGMALVVLVRTLVNSGAKRRKPLERRLHETDEAFVQRKLHDNREYFVGLLFPRLGLIFMLILFV